MQGRPRREAYGGRTGRATPAVAATAGASRSEASTGFEELNERHGHPTGDAVLSAVGHAALRIRRNIDTMARIGGDEFAAILPDTDAVGAFDLTERLRSELAAIVV